MLNLCLKGLRRISTLSKSRFTEAQHVEILTAFDAGTPTDSVPGQ